MGVIHQEDGEDVVRYFADEQEADAASDEESIQRALALAGAWSYLAWPEMEQALRRIRRESMPTPPITEL